MSKKILLVSANTYTSPYPVYPLGVSYLKTNLRQVLPEFEVSVYDLNFGGIVSLEEVLRTGEFRYVGVSLRNIDDNNLYAKNSFIRGYREVTDCIRAHSKACVILGGAGFSIFPDILLQCLEADFGIQGEGESTLAELLPTLEAGENPSHIEGLVFRDTNGEIKVNSRERYAESLTLHFEENWLDYYWNGSGMLNVQTKRGCPHKCIYCSYPVIEGRKVRSLDPLEVVETLKELYFGKHINYVFFTDSVFNIDRNYNEELARRIIESGVKVGWGAYFSPRNLSREDLQLYKQAGLTHIEFGTESFSDQQLENYRKGFHWADVVEKSHFCDDLGIFYAHFLILAGYGETEASLEETFRHSRELTNAVIFPYIGMRIYPDTELFRIALREGRIASREELLNPVYYVAEGVDLTTLQARAKATGARWIFPGEGSEELMARFRAKKRRGPLWEYLRFGGEG